MTKYLFTYHGGNADLPQTQEGIDELMAAWGAWFASMGDAVVDGGNPTGPAKTVGSDASVTDGATHHSTGYGIFEADSLDAAAEVAKGCPVLAGGGSVQVYETIDM